MKRILAGILLLTLVTPLSGATASVSKSTDITTIQSQVMKCIQSKTTKTASCQSLINQLNAWRPNSSTSELVKAQTTILQCMLTGGHSKTCIDAANVSLNWSKIQASYVQSKNNVIAVSISLKAAISSNYLLVDKVLYRKVGTVPLPSGSLLQTSAGNLTLPATTVAYLTLTPSRGSYCVSETTPDKSITWVSTSKNPTPVKGKACLKA